MRLEGIQMYGKTLGIIGTGQVGQRVAKRSLGFDMPILCFDKYPNQAFADQYKAKYVDLDTLLKESDFVTIHSPYTPETKNLISVREFNLMKQDAIIVTTSRGGIVDEDALYGALTTQVIRAAALDVSVGFMADSPQRLLYNCILSPHCGATTKAATEGMADMAVANLKSVLDTGKALNLVPELRAKK
jgi:D-3-phosphoglycerate dehydrogenase